MAGGAVAPKAMRAACFPEFSRQKTEPGQKPTSAATSTRSSRAAISPGRTWRGPRAPAATPPHWPPRAVHLSTLNVEHDASCDPRNGCRWVRMRGVETIGEPFSKRTLLLTRPRATSNPGPSAREQARGGSGIEVVAKATRRRFTVEYKGKIVREADGCKTPGAVGALLRREGLYSSHLTTWRAARERGELAGAPKKRGPARRVVDPRDKKLAAQERELTRWKTRAERAEALVELQKQVAALLGTPLATETS